MAVKYWHWSKLLLLWISPSVSGVLIYLYLKDAYYASFERTFGLNCLYVATVTGIFAFVATWRWASARESSRRQAS